MYRTNDSSKPEADAIVYKIAKRPKPATAPARPKIAVLKDETFRMDFLIPPTGEPKRDNTGDNQVRRKPLNTVCRVVEHFG